MWAVHRICESWSQKIPQIVQGVLTNGWITSKPSRFFGFAVNKKKRTRACVSFLASRKLDFNLRKTYDRDLIGWPLKFASHYDTKSCRWWLQEEICYAECCRIKAGRNSTAAILRATISGMDKRCNFSHYMHYFTVYPGLDINIVIISKHFFEEDYYRRKFGWINRNATLPWKFLMGARVDCTGRPSGGLHTLNPPQSRQSTYFRMLINWKLVKFYWNTNANAARNLFGWATSMLSAIRC